MKRKPIMTICAAILLIAALSVSAFAATSASNQMAANSAAWWVAYNAGDTATCNALHASNVALASQASSGGGSSSFNSSSGSWTITDSSGSTTSSSGSSNGKSNTVTYTTTSSSGAVSSTSNSTYSSSSISAYMNAGGTTSGLQTSYNNAASNVAATGSYGDTVATTAASDEVAVAKVLLGLTDAQAKQLQADLEVSKQAFESAQAAYNAAVTSGNTSAVDAAKAKMDAAHDAAQETRAAYNYTGDSSTVNDGGYYYGTGTNKSDGGVFYTTTITASYNISASSTSGGSISPSGTVSVKKGESQTFAITPSAGYEIKSVTVDGVNKGAITSYTFSNVTATHQISAVFEPSGKVQLGNIAITNSLGASLNGSSIKSGYGIFASVSASYSDVSALQLTMIYNFGFGSKSVTLQETSNGVFAFPVNAASPTGSRCVYIPVETADGTYTLTITVTAKNAAGEVLAETKTASVIVKGNMYEDDFTGDA
jgi:hypothetical protein